MTRVPIRDFVGHSDPRDWKPTTDSLTTETVAVVDEVTKFATGAVRSKDANKTRYDLISPIGLRRLAETYHEGAVKYGDHNWEMGFPISDILNHGIRHVYLYLSGDRSEDHLSHAAWNLFAAMHSEESWPHLNENLRAECCQLTDAMKKVIDDRNAARVAAAKPR